MKNSKTVLVTGSSGYVASELVPLLKETYEVIGVDLRPSALTNWAVDIAGSDFCIKLAGLVNSAVSIVNLAAARFDFGAKAEDYYRLNVSDQEIFLNSLDTMDVETFIHISSVASIDGSVIPYTEDLDCDDAYRSTKYLQEKLVRDWCAKKNIELVVLYPSAIFSNEHRGDTNIGKMQKFAKYIPFVPKISVSKAVTFLPNFSSFIVDGLTGYLKPGSYLTVEKPILTVTAMVKILAGNNKKVIRIPYLKNLLAGVAVFLHVIGGFGRVDLKLTPNRVVKLFSDTTYDVGGLGIDRLTYNSCSSLSLQLILQNLSDDE
jgi:hypothetical protein